MIGHLIGSFSHESEMWVAPRAELESMQVNDGYRGRGLGSTLVEGFREWARARGAVHMQELCTSRLVRTSTSCRRRP